jgi:hypothetical protein
MGFEVVTEHHIAATPDRVWAALLDTAGYPAWNPTIRWRSGALSRGETVRFWILAGSVRLPLSARVDRWEEGRAFGWTGLAGVSRHFASGHHYFEVHPAADGTRLVHGERFRGLPFAFGTRWMTAKLLPRYRALNEALARHVESEDAR